MDRTFTMTAAAGNRPGLLRRSLARLMAWNALARQRAALRVLDERTLRDMGISRHEALAEARRPFWDPPRR